MMRGGAVDEGAALLVVANALRPSRAGNVPGRKTATNLGYGMSFEARY